MAEMPGNGNYYAADHPNVPAGDRQIWALKAIAYEQRTANLIAYAVHNSAALAEGVDVEIRDRLGMKP